MSEDNRYDATDEIDRLRAENARLKAELERVRPVVEAALMLSIVQRACVSMSYAGDHYAYDLLEDGYDQIVFELQSRASKLRKKIGE